MLLSCIISAVLRHFFIYNVGTARELSVIEYFINLIIKLFQ
jgi:hypothetical protein